jgi:hypothetical protein
MKGSRRVVRRIVADRTDVVEKKIVWWPLCCGLTKTDFMVRIGPANYDAALREALRSTDGLHGSAARRNGVRRARGLRKDATLAKWVAPNRDDGPRPTNQPSCRCRRAAQPSSCRR